MGRPRKSNLPAPQSSADDMNEGAKELKDSYSIPSNKKIPLPNGKFAMLTDLIDQDYRPGNHTSMFADPSKFMKNPRGDCMYSWVAYGRPAELMGKIRSGAYRPVDIEEVLDNRDMPIATHRVAGQDFVTIYDVALVEVQPEAVRRLYKWREQTALLKTVRNAAFNEFRKRVDDMSGGLVNASFEVKEIE